MADLLLSALVSTVVRNLNTSALKEFGVAWGLGAELDKLKSTMSAIQAVLEDAEEKQWNSKAITDWLRKLKDVAYDADDVLDEFATEALMRKVDREKGATGQVSRFFSLPNRLIFRMKMAHKLKNVRDRLDAISRERSDFQLKEGLINTEVVDVQRRQTCSLVNESGIYGRDEEKEKIIEVLLTNVSDDQDNLAIYAVWGMGGMGKTTLAQLVYNDVRVEKHFELRIWVCVSDDFQIIRLVRAIIESILVEISLICWERCEHLPTLGKLPFLKVLEITGWHAVKYIGNDFHGDGAISFPSLKEFRLHKMRDLEEWRTMTGGENFPCLSTLRITECPKLVEIPIIPSITSLTMRRAMRC